MSVPAPATLTGCCAGIKDNSEVVWRYFIPRLRHAYSVYPEVAERMRALAARPQTRFGWRGSASDANRLLRLRANLALLWLGVDAGLGPVVEAIEAGIAAQPAEGGAIAPLARGELLSFQGDGGLVRHMLDHQDRLALFNSRDDDIDSTVVRVVKKLARVCVPPVEFDAVTEEQGGVRFIHANRVYEIVGACDEEYGEAAAAFDEFLVDIHHLQRVFMIGNDGGETDNETGAFFCADPVHMHSAAAQIGFPIRLVSDI